MEDAVFKYFPSLSALQKNKITQLKPVYERWNRMINVISRKDMDNFMIHHVLHSLAIAKVISFTPGTRVIDIGTGGGFPGIPLSIMFPETEFFLLDSIGKKIKVITEVAREIDLYNITLLRKRIEEENGKYDFVISRAVTQFPKFVKLAGKNISSAGKNSLDNGIFYLKGGSLNEEIESFAGRVRIWEIREFFGEAYFDTKKIIYLPV